jgi:hypothetical protein
MKLSGPTWVTHTVVFDGKQWVYANELANAPTPEPVPETKRACDCGSSPSDPTHYTWCKSMGAGCAQAEDA